MNNNLLINGNFDLWQRGTTFSISYDDPLSATIYTAPKVKIADRWYVIETQNRDVGATGSVTIYRETIDNATVLSTTSKYNLTVLNQISGVCGGHCYIEHKQENCKIYAGIPLSLSFYAKTLNGVTGTTLAAYYRQAIHPNTKEHSIEFSTKFEITPSWERYTINFTPQVLDFSGISGDHYFGIGFKLLPETNISLAAVKLQQYSDNIDTIVITDPIEEKERQSKYYYSSYPIGVTFGSKTLLNGNDLSAVSFTITPSYSFNYKFENQMRKTPSVQVYSPETGVQNDGFNKSANKDMRLTSGTKGWNTTTRFSPTGAKTIEASGNTYGVQLNVSSGAVIFDEILVHIVADADIDTGAKDKALETFTVGL